MQQIEEKNMTTNKIIFLTITCCVLFLNAFFLVDLNTNNSKYIYSTSINTNKSNDKPLIIQFLKTNHSTLKQTRLNPHTFTYAINPKETICGSNKGENVSLLAFVLTSRKHFKQRELIRKTWSNKTEFPQLRVVFLIGSSNSTYLNDEIQRENSINKDIIQETFQDTYYNLTLKTVMGIKWAAKYCSKAKFILKVDDDVIVNTYSLLNYLDGLIQGNMTYPAKSLLCYYYSSAPIMRRNDSKFYVSYNELNQSRYGQYCDGPAYIFTGDLAAPLYQASLDTKFFKFEDVYFGMLATKLNLRFINLQLKYSKENQILGLIANNQLFTKFYFYPCQIENFEQIWFYITKLNYLS